MRPIVLIAAAFCLAPSGLRAQAPVAPAADTGGIPAIRPTISTIRTNTPPKIDGLLDDPIWRTATRVTEFVQQRPLQGSPATERTEVLIAYDSDKLYFGVYAHYSDPGLVRANRVDRDKIERDDTVQFSFDPFLDQQRGYVFAVNGYGVQGDRLILNQPSTTTAGGSAAAGTAAASGATASTQIGDWSWDSLFFSAGSLLEDGWTVEIAILYKSLRYPGARAGESHRWGFQIQRDITSKDESVVWAPVSPDVPNVLRQMGVLEGMTNLSTSQNFELLPTATAMQIGNMDRTTGAFGTEKIAEAGVNLKYGITPNLTFDFTYNPDFSQIESDRAQIEVNQRFPIMYPELRPFFVEGQEIFRINLLVTLVHTRTIIDPKYGAKLTGKIGKTTLGVVFANDEAPGTVESPIDPAFGKTALFLLSRVRYDLYAASHIGLLFTNREFMTSHSRLGGVDGSFQLGPKHVARFHVMRTDHLDLTGVQRNGGILELRFRRDGRKLTYTFIDSNVSPDFRTDAGFVRRTDTRQVNATMNYRWWPEKWIINWGPRTNYIRNYNYSGVLQDTEIGGGLDAQFARNVNLNFLVLRAMERVDGINFMKTRVSFGGTVSSSRRISVGGNFISGDQVRFVTNPYLGLSADVNLDVTLRPFSRLQSQLGVTTSRFVDVRSDTEVFDVKIFRVLTTYQFTARFLVRNITEYNSFNKTLAVNLLVMYRVNAGTVFFVGYDDHQRQGNQIDALRFPDDAWQRTNRAIFTKVQYLFRR